MAGSDTTRSLLERILKVRPMPHPPPHGWRRRPDENMKFQQENVRQGQWLHRTIGVDVEIHRYPMRSQVYLSVDSSDRKRDVPISRRTVVI